MSAGWDPAWRTLTEGLRARAGDGRPAFTFVDDDGVERDLTFAALDRRARVVGARLDAAGATGQRVLLVFPQGLDFVCAFYGTLSAGAVAVTTPSPLPALRRTLPRIAAIAADAAPAAVLTTAALLPVIVELQAKVPALAAAVVIAVDALDDQGAAGWRPPDADGGALAFLQYTSGSTASPRGVMVTHESVLHNCASLLEDWRHTPDSTTVTWLPVFHDLGLMDGVVQPLYTGYRSVLLSPMAFLTRPLRWLEAVSRFQASYSAGPNFAYDLCVRKSTPAQRAGLDLRCWDSAVIAAEPVRRSTLERFGAAFAPAGFRRGAFCPSYGLAEATLKVATTPRGRGPRMLCADAQALEEGRVVPRGEADADARALLACGDAATPRHGTHAVIAEPATGVPCAPDRIGEIWVKGPGLARGYWRRPEDTAATFGARLANGDGPYLRTGDLGFIEGGQLYVAGRLKDLIIRHGRNIHPHDVELTIEEREPVVRPGCVAAFSVDADDAERLVVYAEVKERPGVDAAALLRRVRAAVLDAHGLVLHELVLLDAGELPKTTSGKIQRHVCRASYSARARAA